MDPELEDMYGAIEKIAKALPTWALENELKARSDPWGRYSEARVMEHRKWFQPVTQSGEVHPAEVELFSDRSSSVGKRDRQMTPE